MFLCIDTATEQSGISLVTSEKSFGYLKLDSRHASDDILQNIDELLRKSDVELADLKGVFVVKGPGSFTGLRVGISVANQFAHQLKILIIGVQTDEWYGKRTDESDFIYLQTMNRDQVFMVGFGKYKRDFVQSIISVSECHYELSSQLGIKWLGQLNDKHGELMAEIDEITDLFSPDETWKRVVSDYPLQEKKKYDLIEPFYGKEPTITKSKRKI